MIAETIRNFDIFSISETKIDSTFPNMQFKISGYKLLDVIVTDLVVVVVVVVGVGEDLMLYLNVEIPCKFLNNHPLVPNAEIICIEFHQLKRK